jgi:hypothetical protein
LPPGADESEFSTEEVDDLTEAELRDKEKYLAKGFSDWNKKDFRYAKQQQQPTTNNNNNNNSNKYSICQPCLY